MIYEILPAHEIKEYLIENSWRHYDDIKDRSIYSKICVNWEVYEELSKEGLCWAVVAKDEGQIVAYNCFTLTADLNDNSEILAIDVAMYIDPKYRGKLVIDFIKKCDKLLGTKEVKRVLRSFSDVRIGKLLERADYKARSITLQKVL